MAMRIAPGSGVSSVPTRSNPNETSLTVCGDQVRVHGDPIQIRFGERVSVSRMATVTRAGPMLRGWTRLAAYFDLKELYEVSFNPGRVR